MDIVFLSYKSYIDPLNFDCLLQIRMNAHSTMGTVNIYVVTHMEATCVSVHGERHSTQMAILVQVGLLDNVLLQT